MRDREKDRDRVWLCVDCRVHTGYLGDYYMVRDEIWEKHGCGAGMLCIECLEARIGRELTSTDFTEALVNKGVMTRRSDLMVSRVEAREGF